MNRILTSIALLLALPAAATDVSQPTLDELVWVARPIVLFADNSEDPRLKLQLSMIEAEAEALEERDVVVIVDTEAESALRTRLRPRDFTFVLIGKDGQIKYRRPTPVPVREISRVIDRMPLRRQEIGRD